MTYTYESFVTTFITLVLLMNRAVSVMTPLLNVENVAYATFLGKMVTCLTDETNQTKDRTNMVQTLDTLTARYNALNTLGASAKQADKDALTVELLAHLNTLQSTAKVDTEIPLGLVDGFDEMAINRAIAEGHVLGQFITQPDFTRIENLSDTYKVRNARFADMPSTLGKVEVATMPQPKRKQTDRLKGESFLEHHIRLESLRMARVEAQRKRRGTVLSAARKLEVQLEAESTARYLADCKLAARLGVDISPSMLTREEIEAFVIAALAKGKDGQNSVLQSGLLKPNQLSKVGRASIADADAIRALLRGCYGTTFGKSQGKVKRPSYYADELKLNRVLVDAISYQWARLNGAHARGYVLGIDNIRENNQVETWSSHLVNPWSEHPTIDVSRTYHHIVHGHCETYNTDRTVKPITVSESRASVIEKLPFWEKGLGVLPNYDYLKSLRFEVEYRHGSITLTTSDITAYDVKHVPCHLAPANTELPLTTFGRADGVYSVFPRPHVVVTAPTSVASASSKGTLYRPAYSTYRRSELIGMGRYTAR